MDESQEMKEIQELKKFNKWRKKVGKTLPDLAKRVFALRGKSYMGYGFHWGLEKDLGWIIVTMNDFDKSYRDLGTRMIVEIRHEQLIERVEEIENEISQ